jgi:hypothetical protein
VGISLDRLRALANNNAARGRVARALRSLDPTFAPKILGRRPLIPGGGANPAMGALSVARCGAVVAERYIRSGPTVLSRSAPISDRGWALR